MKLTLDSLKCYRRENEVPINILLIVGKEANESNEVTIDRDITIKMIQIKQSNGEAGT